MNFPIFIHAFEDIKFDVGNLIRERKYLYFPSFSYIKGKKDQISSSFRHPHIFTSYFFPSKSSLTIRLAAPPSLLCLPSHLLKHTERIEKEREETLRKQLRTFGGCSRYIYDGLPREGAIDYVRAIPHPNISPRFFRTYISLLQSLHSPHHFISPLGRSIVQGERFQSDKSSLCLLHNQSFFTCQFCWTA